MWASSEGGLPEVTLETSMSSFTVELYYKHAPRTCRNFIELSRRGYYDSVKFHRIIKDFIVQGGDPTGTAKGKHRIFGRVCRGMEIIKRLGNVQTDSNDRPIHDGKILRSSVKD
ncbi:peptidyl-prolyl cis-trans isomerase CYP18-2-like isoform X3 [Durio zibethinus]|uniref:Peptidyl-prolyl cis-trans isomerase n=1 Tax=Durio zibethinus TaxID=66656 RepID=A0A6P5YRW3_DURZI|nr:peptidyl-prolyl cis-trans isomerase CYP18-2-like isoform X3 [Durio zibethinus]